MKKNSAVQENINPNLNRNFLKSAGEMGQLLNDHDWSKTSLGNICEWPQSLRTTLSILLNSKFPMFLFWGKDHLCFYNDAYRPSLGNNGKHPAALGQKGADCWPEIWEFIQPIINNVMAGKEASYYEDQLLPIYRNGKIEDVYWTFSYSAVIDETGLQAGVFVTCSETTDKIKILKTIRENKEELEFAINAAELGTWDLNPLNNKLTINNRLKSWFGIEDGSEVDLDNFIEIISSEDKSRISEAVKTALNFSSGGDYNVEYKIINSVNKSERIVRAIGKVLFDEKKMPYRFNGILQDITKETLSRTLLMESENNFRNLVEQAPVAICVLKEPDYVVTIANVRMLELWGKTSGDVLKKPIFVGLPEARAQGLEELLLNVFTTGERFVANELPVTLLRKGKLEQTYLNFVYEAFKDNHGRIEGIMVVATDVTEQVNARLKIEDAEERARLAADAVDLGIYDLNLISGELVISKRALKIFGFDREASRDELIRAIHADDRNIQIQAHKDLIKNGFLFYEIRVVWSDGSVHWIRVQGKVYFNNSKLPSRLLGTILDITKQKEAEAELIKINQRLEIALEVGQLGSYELNLTTGVINGSEQFWLNFGLDKNAPLTLETLIEVVMPSERQKILDAFNEAVNTNSVYNVEYKIKWPDNSFRWIKSSAKARYDDNFKPNCFIGVTLDITEHKQLQQQKDDFLGIASHELKTPVTTIKAYSQILEEMLLQKGDVKEASMVTKMGAQVNRLTNLISDLLDVTKINTGKLQLNNTHFNFNLLVIDIIEDIQNTVPNIYIEKRLLPTGFVFADKERIVQVITNLITNAIKYSPNAKKIIVHTMLENKEIVLCVEDFGVGISKNNQKKVFEQFYRVSGDMQHTFPGLGLGLYISSEIIKRIGGRIWVNSVEGDGATFCFSLPTEKSSIEDLNNDLNLKNN